MLVLSRKPGERILVGNDVVITIVRIGPNTVRLGIDAPGHMNIVREELCDFDVVRLHALFPDLEWMKLFGHAKNSHCSMRPTRICC